MKNISVKGKGSVVFGAVLTLILCSGCNQYDENFTPDYAVVTNTFEEDMPVGIWDLLQPVNVVTGEGIGYDGSKNCVQISERPIEFSFDADEQGNSAYVYDAVYVCCASEVANVRFEGTFVDKKGNDVSRSVTVELTREVNADSGYPVWVRVDLAMLSYDVSAKTYSPLKSLTVVAFNPAKDGNVPLVYLDNVSVRLF